MNDIKLENIEDAILAVQEKKIIVEVPLKAKLNI